MAWTHSLTSVCLPFPTDKLFRTKVHLDTIRAEQAESADVADDRSPDDPEDSCHRWVSVSGGNDAIRVSSRQTGAPRTIWATPFADATSVTTWDLNN